MMAKTIDFRMFKDKYSKQDSQLLLQGERNDELREIGFTFSSEAEVDQYFFREVISHDSDGIDLSRIAAGKCNLLFNHDRDKLIGNIRKGIILPEKKGLANARFSKADSLATRIYQDVCEDIIKTVSFGYAYRDFEILEDGKDREDGKPLVRAKVTVMEISIVSVPADYGIGIRSGFDDVHSKRDFIKDNPQIKVFDLKTKESKPMDHEEIVQMLSLAQKFNRLDMYAKYVGEKRGLAEFQKDLLADIGSKEGTATRVDADPLGVSEREAKSYSFVRAVRACVLNDWSEAGFERECSMAAQKKYNKKTEGFLIPPDILRSSSMRAAGDPALFNTTTGAGIIGAELKTDSFIEQLRSKIILYKLGVQVLDGLEGLGSVGISRQTGGATAEWVGESKSAKGTNVTTDKVIFTPKTISAWTDLSRKLILTASHSANEIAKRDLQYAIASATDKAGFGFSANIDPKYTPLGVCNDAAISALKVGTAGKLTFDDIVKLETKVTAADVEGRNFAYVTNAKVRGLLKSTLKTATGNNGFLWEQNLPDGDGFLNGYRCAITNGIPNDQASNLATMIFGLWSDMMIGEWSVLDVLVNPFGNNFEAGDVRIRVLQDIDIQKRHNESFTYLNDIKVA